MTIYYWFFKTVKYVYFGQSTHHSSRSLTLLYKTVWKLYNFHLTRIFGELRF